MAGISLDPDQIRTIREGLGLSQREAGNLLGGGPNAFAKYESGTLAPSGGGTPLVEAGRRGMGFEVSGVNHQHFWLWGIRRLWGVGWLWGIGC